jgi:hypothetical protein
MHQPFGEVIATILLYLFPRRRWILLLPRSASALERPCCRKHRDWLPGALPTSQRLKRTYFKLMRV